VKKKLKQADFAGENLKRNLFLPTLNGFLSKKGEIRCPSHNSLCISNKMQDTSIPLCISFSSPSSSFPGSSSTFSSCLCQAC